MRIPLLILIPAAALILSGCGRKAVVRPPEPAPSSGMIEEGIASWYGKPYHGRPTASGEIYDMEKQTAAHRTLPFGTHVRVESMENHKTVDVRINDRGPLAMDRIIDLSRAAARQLNMLGSGTARVRLEVLFVSDDAGGARYAVQVGAFREKRRAEKLCRDMREQFGDARLVEAEGMPMWRVLVGRGSTMNAAAELARRIRSESPEKAGNAIVVCLDRQSGR